MARGRVVGKSKLHLDEGLLPRALCGTATRIVMFALMPSFIAVLVGFSTMAVVAAALFRRGKWKRVAV